MSTSTDRSNDPIEHLLDLFVYAPIGLLAKGSESFPDLVERGRTQARTAKVVGSFALGAGNTKAREKLADAERQFGEFLRIVADSASVRSSGSAKESGAASSDVVADGVQDSSIDDLIDGYDSMPANAIVKLLSGLEPAGLDRVEAHETAGRSRVTILNRIRQLRG